MAAGKEAAKLLPPELVVPQISREQRSCAGFETSHPRGDFECTSDFPNVLWFSKNSLETQIFYKIST